MLLGAVPTIGYDDHQKRHHPSRLRARFFAAAGRSSNGNRQIIRRMETYNLTNEMWVERIKNQTPPEPDDNFNAT